MRIGMLVFASFLIMMGQAEAQFSQYEKFCHSFIASKGRQNENVRFKNLLNWQWSYTLKEYPEYATYVGEPGFDDQWTDLSKKSIERRKRELHCFHKAVLSLNPQRLTPHDQLSYQLLLKEAKMNIEGSQYLSELLPLHQMSGVHQTIPQVLLSSPKQNKAQIDALLSRLEKAPLLIEQTVLLLKQGLSEKLMPPRVTIAPIPAQVRALLKDDVKQSPLFEPFRDLRSVTPSEREKFHKRALTLIQEKLYPALRDFAGFVEKEYLPQTTEKLAREALPNGVAWYDYLVRWHTTTQLKAEAIHELGLKEVSRLHQEMNDVMNSAGFKGTVHEFAEFLRTDPQFFLHSKEELLMRYRDIAKRADPELLKLFGRLPRTPYGVRPVPEYSEQSQPTAYYEPGSAQSGRAGIFFANTYDLKARPWWEMEALTLHEAVPGHHLQISLAQELENVPNFRKHYDQTAFIEGWGLYAESLGLELGFYQNPYSNFGRLTYEMWRACRLVVDTGLHHYGWSREKAIAYMKENLAKSERDIEVEVDRYVAMPGQALAYKMGELAFKRLRTEAKQKLGDKFDIRAFHDTALAEGALPLDVLESQIRVWIDRMLK